MRASFFNFLRQIDVIFEVILGAFRIENITCVTDRCFAELVFLQHRIHRYAHVFDPVQTVENAEQIDAAACCLAHEIFYDIIGIRFVADAVCTAQKHLQKKVRRRFTHQRQTLPRVFGEEAHRNVECRTAPAFQRKQIRQCLRIGIGDAGNVVCAHARRQKRLMAVTHGRIGNQRTLFVAHPFRELLRSKLVQTLLGAINDRLITEPRHARLGGILSRLCAPLGFWMAIDRHVGDIG